MKTAMQELIEWANKEINAYYNDESPRLRTGLGMAVVKATELLEKEKQQIEIAYLAGWGNSSDYHADYKKEITDEQYFNQTYNS